MKAGAGKRKGSGFERRIAREFSKWVTGQMKPEIFWRTPDSGAKSTSDRKRGVDSRVMHGDIMASNEEGLFFTDHFFIECKDYRDWSITKILEYRFESKVLRWWKKAMKEAREVDKTPLLLFKRRNSPVYIMFDQEGMDFFTEKMNSDPAQISQDSLKRLGTGYIMIRLVNFRAYIMLFDKWTEWCDPRRLGYAPRLRREKRGRSPLKTLDH